MRLIVPAVDLQQQYDSLRDELLDAIRRLSDRQQFTLGSEVAEFEEAVAEFCGARYAVGVSSGTDALLVALMAARVGRGDDVITPAFSHIASADVITRLGARPVLVDIEPDSFNIDAAAAVAAITTRTKAIIAVHLFGRCADLDPVLVEALERGITVIEDAAQAFGTRDYRDRIAGTLGHMAAFSFSPRRSLGGFGDGGMVVTSDGELCHRLRSLRVHGAGTRHRYPVIGGNFRLDAIQAAVLRIKLPHVAEWSAARRTRAERYRALFAASGLLDQVALPADVLGHVYAHFVVRSRKRSLLRAYLRRSGIGTEVLFPLPLHLQECFSELGHRRGDFPQAEAAARTALALPMYSELSQHEQAYVVENIRAFFAQNGEGDVSGDWHGGSGPGRDPRGSSGPRTSAGPEPSGGFASGPDDAPIGQTAE